MDQAAPCRSRRRTGFRSRDEGAPGSIFESRLALATSLVAEPSAGRERIGPFEISGGPAVDAANAPNPRDARLALRDDRRVAGVQIGLGMVAIATPILKRLLAVALEGPQPHEPALRRRRRAAPLDCVPRMNQALSLFCAESARP